MVLQNLITWQPFRIDALGLVTVLGAEEMNMAVGQLLYSWVTEWLPLLGAYTVASNSIARPIGGFVLYNITDGITAYDISACFSRWLLSYPLTYTATTITLRIDGKPVPIYHRAFAFILGVIVNVPLLILSVIMKDSWGVANMVAMIISILVRRSIVNQNRDGLDRAVMDFSQDPGPNVKIFLTLPNGKAITLYGPRMAIVNCVLTDPRPAHPWFYSTSRIIGWAAFGVHVITLGMAKLFNQLLCVMVLITSTILLAQHVGGYRHAFGTRLYAEVDLGNPAWLRSPVYARLALSEAEEDYMVHWNLFPKRNNARWWNKYRHKHEVPMKAARQDQQANSSSTSDTEESGHAAMEPSPSEQQNSLQEV